MSTRPLPTGLLAASGNPGPAPTYGASAGYGYGGGYGGAGQTANGASAGGAGGGGYSGYGASTSGDYGSGSVAPSSSSATPSAGYYAAGGTASPSTGNYGQSPAPSAPQSPASSATASYGVQSLSAYGGLPPAGSKTASPASSYPSAATPVHPQAAYAPTGASPSAVPRNTQIYGQTLTNWQPALPVSPWSTIERSPASGANLATETILKSDLKKLRSSRLKAWFYLFVVLGVAGTAGYYGFGHFQKLVSEKNASKDELARLRVVHNETLAKANGAPAAVGQKPAPGTPAAAPGVASANTTKLSDELKRVLGGSPLVAVETRGDRVVVSLEGAALFSGRETEVGLGGYRTLYKFGKTLKLVKDRRVFITVPSVEIKRFKAWNLAAARAVSLGRFFTDDLGFDRGRVLVATPAPRMAGRIPNKSGVGRVEFVLEPLGG